MGLGTAWKAACAAGLVASSWGCAGADNLLAGAFQKAAEPTKETPEQEQWRWAVEKREPAANRPKVADADSFGVASRAVDTYRAQLEVYIDGHCKEARAEHCDEADKMDAEAADWQRATYEQAMAVPSIDFDVLQDKIMTYERKNAARGVSIDPWMEDLGKRKLGYWSNELGAQGGTLAKYAAAKGETICLAYSSDPTKSDTKNIDFMFKGGETIWMKCGFTRPPSELTRNDGDYWRIELMWSGEWEDIQLTYDVAKPSTTETVVFSFPADVVRERIERKAQSTGFLYPGKWLRVRASYTTRYITGQAWQDEKWVDTWKHEPVAEGSVYFKWK